MGVAAALFFWRRRKTQNASSTTSSPPGTPNTNKPLPPLGGGGGGVDEKKIHELPSELPDADTASSYHNVPFHLPQELPATAAASPSPSQMAHEAQAQRYELDSTPVSR